MLTRRQSDCLCYIQKHQPEYRRRAGPRIKVRRCPVGSILTESGFLARRIGHARSIEVLHTPEQSAREMQLLGVLPEIAGLSVLAITADPDLPRRIAGRVE